MAAIRNHAIYRRLDNPPGDAARQSCYLTGVAGPCIDTGADIYMEGTLVISVAAVRELAEVAGFSVVDGEKLEQENAHLVHENAELIKRVNELVEDNEAAARVTARKSRRDVS